jgi:hypothetical protein
VFVRGNQDVTIGELLMILKARNEVIEYLLLAQQVMYFVAQYPTCTFPYHASMRPRGRSA